MSAPRPPPPLAPPAAASPPAVQAISLDALPPEQQQRLKALADRVLAHFEAAAAPPAAAAAEPSAAPASAPAPALSREQLYAMTGYTKVLDEDVRAVVDRYELGGVAEWRVLPGGLSNTNLRVSTRSGRLVLFKVCDEKGVEALRVQILLLELLRTRGVPAAYPLFDRDGCALQLRGELRVILYDFLPGAHPKSATPAIMAQLGAHLAALHSISQVPAALPEFPMGAVQWRPFLDNELPRAPLAAAAHPFVSRLRDALRTLGPLAESAAWPRRILHGDVFLENVMCEGERVVAIVDWEECCAGPPLLDVAMTLVGCCYSERNVLEWPLAEAFLRAYHASLPLSAQARDALPDFLRYALFSIAFWRFRQFRVRRPDAAREDAFAQMTARIDSLDEPRLRSLCAQLA